MKDFLTKLYILAWMGLAVVFIYVIWQVTFQHVVEEYYERQESVEIEQMREEIQKEQTKSSFQKIILESEETVKLYLGYRVLEEKRIEGHFHHIDFEIGPDKRSLCIKCHGDMPHDNIPELRAFLNMHAFFINCLTCHITIDKSKVQVIYKWYDRTSGEIVESPVGKSKPGTYKAKIIPLEVINNEPQRIDSKESIDFAAEYTEAEKELTDAQKSRAKKLIHKRVAEKPHVCQDCHQKENPLLPLRSLGYTDERRNIVLSTEVVGMIDKYTEFFIPKMLHPGEGKKK